MIIDDGTNLQEMPHPGRYAAMSSRSPFSFFITQDGSINLRGEIRNSKGCIIAEATGDSIRVIQAKEFDINSDTKAIEVVGSNQRPLFQLTVIPYEDYIAEKEQRRSVLETKYAISKSPQVEILNKKKIDEVIRLYY